MDDGLLASSAKMADAARYAEWTFELFSPLLEGSVLEVGCGVGNFTQKIADAPRVSSLLSIDTSASAAAHARELVRSSKARIENRDLFSVEERFRTVVCMHVLEHIEDDEAALLHLIDRLELGGTLFLMVPAHRWLYSSFDVSVGHHRRYSKRSLSRLVDAIARSRPLSVEQLYYFNPVAALGYFALYRVFGRREVKEEVGTFDRYFVPILRRLETRRNLFGIALAAVIQRG